MTHCRRSWSLVRHVLFIAGLVAVLPLPAARAQNKVQAPVWKHGMDLKVRKAGDVAFEKATPFGVECFVDPNTGKLVYISETGSIAALSGAVNAGGGDNKARAPEWQYAMELRVRQADAPDFDNKTRKIGVEVYRDPNTNNLIYITEAGSIAAIAAAAEAAPAKGKEPEWYYGLYLPVRKSGEKEFTRTTQRYGVEAFVDAANGNLIYITEIGTIAVVSGAGLPARPAKVQDPERKHAMELKVRSAGDADFNDKTPKVSLEVYHDANLKKLILITESGSISVLNGDVAMSEKRNPEWRHGLEMGARKAGQREFDKSTPKYGMEVFADEITNAVIYIAQTGAVAAVAK